MTTDLAISLLKKGNTGEQILLILDSISVGDDSNQFDGLHSEPVSDPIEF
jgi:hypothetical protein